MSNELRKSVYLDRLQSMAAFQGVSVDDLDHLSKSQAWDDACGVIPGEEWEEED
jgi:hypothetical protein